VNIGVLKNPQHANEAYQKMKISVRCVFNFDFTIPQDFYLIF